MFHAYFLSSLLSPVTPPAVDSSQQDAYHIHLFHSLSFVLSLKKQTGQIQTPESSTFPRMMSCTCMLRYFKKLIALFLASILILSRISARFVVEKNNIRVLSRLSLRTKHDGGIGNFGKPDYGGFIKGSVVYPDEGPIGCEPFAGVPFKSKFPGLYVLLDRGECYFALKVWRGQQAGAAAVLETDSIDEPLITMDSPKESTDSNEYVEKIEIPSVLIEKSFGDRLKEALKEGEHEAVKLDWRESMPHPNQRVE